MNIIKASILPFLLLFIYGCSSNQEMVEEGPVSFDKTVKAIDQLDTLKISRSLLETSSLVANDEFLFSLDRKSNPVVKVYDHKTGAYQGGFGTLGGGPGEYNMPIGFSIWGDKVVISDIKYVRSYDVVMEQGILNAKLNLEAQIPVAYMPLNSTFMLNDSIVAGKVDLSMDFFSSFNVNTQTLSGYGAYPGLALEIPKKAYHHLYQSRSRMRPDGAKIATTFSNFPLLRIIDVKRNDHKDVFVQAKHEQREVVADAQGRSIKSFDLYKYFENIQVNDELVLSSYVESEIVRDENRFVVNTLTNPVILAFDWEGKPVIKLQVEEWMSRYTITPDNRIIFFHPEEKDELYIIDLNKLLN